MQEQTYKIFMKLAEKAYKFVFLQGVSLIRPAPVQLPQVRKEARVQRLSGAI